MASAKDRAAELARELVEAVERMPDEQPEVPSRRAVVSEQYLAKSRGYAVGTLQRYRSDGTVTKGLHWFMTPAKRIVWDEEAFDRWQKGEPEPGTPASASELTAPSRSASPGKAHGYGSESSADPRRPDFSRLPASDKRSSTATG